MATGRDSLLRNVDRSFPMPVDPEKRHSTYKMFWFFSDLRNNQLENVLIRSKQGGGGPFFLLEIFGVLHIDDSGT